MKDRRINLRLTAQEEAIIRARAERCCTTVSGYMIRCATRKNSIIIFEGAEELIRQVKAIGNNLNQLTALANARKISTVNLTETNYALFEIQNSLQELLERR